MTLLREQIDKFFLHDVDKEPKATTAPLRANNGVSGWRMCRTDSLFFWTNTSLISSMNMLSNSISPGFTRTCPLRCDHIMLRSWCVTMYCNCRWQQLSAGGESIHTCRRSNFSTKWLKNLTWGLSDLGLADQCEKCNTLYDRIVCLRVMGRGPSWWDRRSWG